MTLARQAASMAKGRSQAAVQAAAAAAADVLAGMIQPFAGADPGASTRRPGARS